MNAQSVLVVPVVEVENHWHSHLKCYRLNSKELPTWHSGGWFRKSGNRDIVSDLVKQGDFRHILITSANMNPDPCPLFNCDYLHSKCKVSNGWYLTSVVVAFKDIHCETQHIVLLKWQKYLNWNLKNTLVLSNKCVWQPIGTRVQINTML